jgi:ferredoxin
VTIRVRVDEELCQGHARCGMTAPEVFGFRDDDGHAVVLCDPVPPQHEEAARRAVIGCPERALTLRDD